MRRFGLPLRVAIPLTVLIVGIAASAISYIIATIPVPERIASERQRAWLDELSTAQSFLESHFRIDDLSDIQRYISSFGVRENLEHLAMVDEEGTIISSIHLEVVGRKFIDVAPLPLNAIFHKQNMGRSPLFETTTKGLPKLAAKMRICAPVPSGKLNGEICASIILLENIAPILKARLGLHRDEALLNGTFIVLICMLLVLILDRALLRRVHVLVTAARDFGAGDLTRRSALNDGDELTKISFAMDAMLDRVEEQNQQIRQSQDAYRQRSQLLDAILNASPATFTLRNIDGSFVYLNDAYARLIGGLGVPAEKLLGKSLSDFLAPVRCGDLTEDLIAKVAETGEPILNLEYKSTRIAEDRTFLLNVVPVREADGKINSVITMNLEISDLRRAEEAVREGEARLLTAFENVTVGNIVIDEEGKIQHFNRAASQIFDYTPDELIGQNVAVLMPEPDRSQHDDYIRRYKETGKANIIGTGREVVAIRKNGDAFPIHLGIGEMTSGGRQYFVGTITDLTDLKDLEQRLFRAQRLEAVGQLTGGVAHDFNNAMSTMLGNAELLEDMLEEDSEAIELIRAIIAAVERGAALTHRLLAFSRRQALSPAPTDIPKLIDGMKDLLARALGEDISFKTFHIPTVWTAQVDPAQLESAILNLALNARDAMPNGGSLTIETDNATIDEDDSTSYEDMGPGEYIRIAVSDSGEGISEDVLSQVFEPFFTTKAPGKGSGLGLSMVYGFAKQSNGHVSIYSEIGKGTTVKIYIPKSYEGIIESAATSELRIMHKGEGRILVVEDDEGVRTIATQILRGMGYKVYAVGSGPEAIEILKSSQDFDLLFTDVVLPGGMNGVQVAADAEKFCPGIKVLYATGYTQNAVVHNGVLDANVTLVNKPYRRAELAEKINQLLQSQT